ncbi:hypothetical protein CI238_01868, partial [Colletotrichum incanum]
LSHQPHTRTFRHWRGKVRRILSTTLPSTEQSAISASAARIYSQHHQIPVKSTALAPTPDQSTRSDQSRWFSPLISSTPPRPPRPASTSSRPLCLPPAPSSWTSSAPAASPSPPSSPTPRPSSSARDALLSSASLPVVRRDLPRAALSAESKLSLVTVSL